jgi:hypothetical protein
MGILNRIRAMMLSPGAGWEAVALDRPGVPVLRRQVKKTPRHAGT